VTEEAPPQQVFGSTLAAMKYAEELLLLSMDCYEQARRQCSHDETLQRN
jgi:hypothetical protein